MRRSVGRCAAGRYVGMDIALQTARDLYAIADAYGGYGKRTHAHALGRAGDIDGAPCGRERAKTNVEERMKERVLVTGGTGFLGRHMVAALCRQGYRLRVLTRRPQAHLWLERYSNVEVFEADLRNKQALKPALDGVDAVVHAAGLFSMWHDAGDFIGTNVHGTQNLLEAVAQSGVKRLLYVSTVAVVGEPEDGRIVDELHPAHPADLYQESKLEAERLVLEATTKTGLHTVVLRPGAFYGALGNYAFNRLFFVDPMRGIIMQMDGGKYVIFPVYIRDVASAIVLGLTRGGSGEVYNICGECMTHRQAFDIICSEANIRFPRLNIPKFVGLNFARLLTIVSKITRIEPFYPIGLRSYVFNDWNVSSEKAKRELGFVPTPFAEGVRETLAWYRSGKPTHLPELDC